MLVSGLVTLLGGVFDASAQNPIHVTYLWHMHQPIYFPYESVQATDNANRFAFSVAGVHGERTGNYGDWPKNAVQQGADRGLPNAGVQVSFSGSLMENLNGLWGFGWRDHWRWARNGLRTVRDNPRLDLVGFAYHHSLMPLTSYESMRMQIRLHKEAYKDNWNTGGTYSKGFFPPESSFALHMIPALVDEGIEWVMVDSGHFDRTLEDFPWSAASSIRPNRSEFRNGNVASKASTWVQLQNVWAPTPVAAPFSYQPHRVRYVDPNSSPENPSVKSMVAVPAARYEGNENGRGGYGAFKPENVWGSQVDKNNNAQRPMIILCHSDGDNFGMKNADAFHGQHGNFLTMIQNNPNFSHTTVQDYLELYPVPTNDFIHVEAGSWVGIDGGTPYFDKWIENNSQNGQHPDYWSWSVVIAAQNRVLHADNLEHDYTMNDIRWGIGPDTAKAWRYFLQSETSCHWYWDYDTANPWDGNATRAANLAVAEANKVINRHPGVDNVGPSIFHPQRKIWNPGGKHWNEPGNQPSNFDVWTFVDDVSGVSSVTLKWRTGDYDSYKNVNEYAHELYAHSPGKNSAWNSVPMTGDWYPSGKGSNVPDPASRAMRYNAMVQGASNTLVSYYIEAVDTKGNTNKTHILHVWVGESTGGGGVTSYVEFDPPAPDGCGPVTIKYKKAGSPLGAGQVYIHVGRNNWQGTIIPNPAMTDSGDYWTYVYNPPAGTLTINAVFNNGSGSWDNNGGQDWNVAVANCSGGGSTNPVVAFSNDPRDCAPLGVTYQATNRPLSAANPVYLMVSFDAGQNWTDYAMTNQGNLVWTYAAPVPSNATNAMLTFHDNGAGESRIWDGGDYSTAIRICGDGVNTGPSVVVFSPASPSGCEPVTITYHANDGPLKNAQPVRIHIGRNGWQDVVAPAPAMTLQPNGSWTYVYHPAPGTFAINCVFNNGSGTWDNNNGQDWSVLVTGCDEISGLVITTPSTNISVAGDVEQYVVSGLAEAGIIGQMTWSNSLTGLTGSFAASSNWTAGEVALGFGANLITVIGTNAGSSFAIHAQDAATNYSGNWTNGSNLGTGFGPWNLNADVIGGHFIGAGGFGLWAQITNLSEAIRPFPAPMAVGQKFQASMKNNYILEGQQGVGMALRNSEGISLLQFFFNGGDDFYTISDAGGGRSSGINWTDQAQTVAVELVTSDSYIMTVGAVTLTGTVNGVISQARFWNYNGGTGSNYDFYFNNLQLTSAASGEGDSFSDSVTITRLQGFVDSDHDGIDDAWEMLHFGNLTTANETSDWDDNGVRDIHEFRAGTNPKDPSSFLRAAHMEMRHSEGRIVLHWPGAQNRHYDVYRTTNLIGGSFICVQSNMPYIPAMNVYTDEVNGADSLYYWIGVKQP